jgi:hypothetical protein
MAILTTAAALTVFQHYSCGRSRPPNRDTDGASGVWPTATRDLGARSGSATPCSINNYVLLGDRLDCYCHTWGADDQWWTYVSAFDYVFPGEFRGIGLSTSDRRSPLGVLIGSLSPGEDSEKSGLPA